MSNQSSLPRRMGMPPLLYGTAWKEDRTQHLTEMAIREGFRGIDTANQRKHYDEAAVGRGLAACVQRGWARREDLFLQTKFTFVSGQDHRLPYDPAAPVAAQIEQSLASSLEHLGVERIDCYLLHGPSRHEGLTQHDWEAWRAMEALRDEGRIRLIGVSNVSLSQLQPLVDQARTPPAIVQNRCYAALGWDKAIRFFCSRNEIVYQGFSLLTANRAVLAHPALSRIAGRHGKTPAQVVFRFAVEIGIVPLTGTTSPEHMRADLDIFQFHLNEAEIGTIETLLMTS